MSIDIILAYTNKKIILYEKYVEKIKDNPQALVEFIQNHEATQQRHIYANSKITAYTHLIHILIAQKNPIQCIQYSQELLSFWDQNYEYYRLLGDCFMLIPDTKQAYTAYKTAWRIQPKNTYLTNKLIDIATKEENFKEIDYIKQIAKTYPNTDAAIQVYLAKDTNTFSPMKRLAPITIPVDNTRQNKTISLKKSKKQENRPNYIFISPTNHPGKGTSFNIQSLKLHLDNAQIITLSSFDQWETRQIKRQDKTFIISGFQPYIRSPKLDLPSPIKSIELEISFNHKQ